MTKEEAIHEIEKVFEPAFANYIITALTEGATSSDKEQQPCEDCISREEALEEACEFIEIGYNGKGIFRRLKELPSVTPIRPYGHWITNSDYPDKLICSECNSKFDVWWMDKGSNYCPNCGAKMKEEENETNN